MLAWTSWAAARASCWKRCDVGGVGGQVAREHLERHLPAQRHLLGQIDLGHRPPAQPPQQAIVAQLPTRQIDVERGFGRRADRVRHRSLCT